MKSTGKQKPLRALAVAIMLLCGAPASPAGSGGVFCPAANVPHISDGPDKSCDPFGHTLIGDPVDIANGATIVTRLDGELKGSVSTLKLRRIYTSRPEAWNYTSTFYAQGVAGVPRPFGSSNADTAALKWWHTFFSFVNDDGTTAGVRTTTGRLDEFTNVGVSGCTGYPYWLNAGQVNAASRTRLRADSQNGSYILYTYMTDDGTQYVYSATFQSPAGVLYTFLDHIVAPNGVQIAKVNYTYPPHDVTLTGTVANCPAGGAAGAPYVSSVMNEDGDQFLFTYKAQGTVPNVECVLDTIFIANPNSNGTIKTAIYTYASSAQSADLASASIADSADGVVRNVESYTYGTGNSATVAMPHAASVSSVNDTYTSAGAKYVGGQFSSCTTPVPTTTLADPQSSESIVWNKAGHTCADQLSSAADPCNYPIAYYRAVTATKSTAGDGTSTPETLLSEYYTIGGYYYNYHDGLVDTVTTSCTGAQPNACPNTTTVYGWLTSQLGTTPNPNPTGTTPVTESACSQNGGLNTLPIGYQAYTMRTSGTLAVDTVTPEHASATSPPRPLAVFPLERVGVIRGVVPSGSPPTYPQVPTAVGYHQDAVQNYYQYLGFPSDSQAFIQTKTRISEDPGFNTRVGSNYQYENGTATGTGPNSRLAHEWRLGRTQGLAGTWQTEEHHMFYSKGGTGAATCSTSSADPLGRTIEVHGPCAGNASGGWTSTDCSSAAPFPVTRIAYYGATGDFKAGKVSTVTRYAGGCNTGGLVTQYNQYDAWGNPTSIVDPSGATFALAWVDHRIASLQVDSDTPTTFTYENGELASVRRPQGNYEVFCHHTVAPGTSCSGSSNWSPKIAWRAKAANSDGTGAGEVITYEYWGDGRLKTVTMGIMASGAFAPRKIHQYSPDPLDRDTFESLGSGGGDPSTAPIKEIRGFDGLDRLAGVGLPFNNAPAFCAAPNSMPGTSQLCALMTAEPRGYQDSLQEFPTSTSAAITTRYCYNQSGHLSLVTRNATVDWNTSATDATCTIQGTNAAANELNSIRYQWDDFGRLVSVTSPETSDGAGGRGVMRLEYDVAGNVVGRQTAQQRASNVKRTFTYDQLQRVLTVVHWVSSTPTTLYSFAYDSLSSDPCPGSFSGLTRTAGRLIKETDPGGDATYFGYDSYGNLKGEYRTRNGGACSTTSSDATPNTTYVYSANGNLTSVTYPHGRTVGYSYNAPGGGLDDRVSQVSATTWSNGAWSSPVSIITSVTWEPYGGLHNYIASYWAVPGDPYVVAYDHGAASSTSAITCSSALDADDLSGRLRSLSVSSGAPPPFGNIYKRMYRWSSDQVLETDTCYSTTQSSPQQEHYGDSPLGYDQLLRIQNVQAPNWNSVGGPRTNGWTYASPQGNFGNRTRWNVDEFGDGYSTTYSTAAATPSWLYWYQATGSNYQSYYIYSGGNLVPGYDQDGRMTNKYWPGDSGGAPAYTMGMTYDAQAANGGVDGVLRSVNVNGTTYQYWYDAENRRRRKVYPFGSSYYDEYFYTPGHQMLEDRGFASSSDTSARLDEYIWLGARPVAYFRSGFNSSGQRLNDGTGTCPRFSDISTGTICGIYYPVTDHAGKAVVVYDSNKRVTGVGEYDAFGTPNRVQWWAESAHPYANNLNTTLNSFSVQTVNGMTNTVRLHFPMFDVEHVQTCDPRTHFCSWSGDSFLFQKGASPFTTLETDTGYHRGDVWTGWYTSTTSPNFRMQLVTDGQNCNPSSCNNGTGWPYSGIALREWEYQRYSSGAAPVFTPLRFPGQYHDNETDLNENWNRFYEPLTGRYLSPEPMSRNPRFVARMGKMGHSIPAYAYALDNPIGFGDRSGLWVVGVGVSASAAVLFGLTGDLFLVVDGHGNVGFVDAGAVRWDLGVAAGIAPAATWDWSADDINGMTGTELSAGVDIGFAGAQVNWSDSGGTTCEQNGSTRGDENYLPSGITVQGPGLDLDIGIFATGGAAEAHQWYNLDEILHPETISL